MGVWEAPTLIQRRNLKSEEVFHLVYSRSSLGWISTKKERMYKVLQCGWKSIFNWFVNNSAMLEPF